MSNAAKNTWANTLEAVASGGSLAVVSELVSIDSMPEVSRQMIDATTLDQASQAEAIIPAGTYKVGALQFTIHHLDQNTGDTLFYGAASAGTKLDLRITVKKSSGTGTWSFSGYVTSYKAGPQTKDGKQTMQITIQPDGAITKA